MAEDLASTSSSDAPSETVEALAEIDLAAGRRELVDWYEDDHRALPWRDTTDAYAILVAEVMSQQTQLDRVSSALHAFLDRWPTVDALAAAERADVVGFWTDHRLGYNNRARYLHEAAGQITEGTLDGVPAGEVPSEPDRLTQLQGVGPYTANAVASLAFNAGNAVVDTNVKRVLYRAFEGIKSQSSPDYESLANALMPDDTSRVWNNAIMELGGVACQKTPRCDDAGCPWRGWCHAYRTGDFTAPDVPEQPSFEGSRRQFRGRVIRALSNHGQQRLDDLGPRVRVEYTPESEHGREWLRGLLSDLAADGLVEVESRDGDGTGDGDAVARLRE